ncbi:MAG: rhodanese-like domain-containing protein [Bdellovibrionota bacterium]
MKPSLCFRFFVLSLALATPVLAEPIENRLIDAPGFASDVKQSLILREQRRLTEEQFVAMANDPNTIVLDARSANRYEQLHIKGARSLPFTEFTAQALAEIIPSKETRVLIYCNNNVANSPIAFASKLPSASLNLSTFTALYTYGYRNVYELGPLIDPTKTAIPFDGALEQAAR